MSIFKDRLLLIKNQHLRDHSAQTPLPKVASILAFGIVFEFVFVLCYCVCVFVCLCLVLCYCVYCVIVLLCLCVCVCVFLCCVIVFNFVFVFSVLCSVGLWIATLRFEVL